MIVKIHNAYRMIVAICDSDLLGKRFEDNDKQIDLTGNFFKGEKMDEKKVLEIIEDAQKEDATFNIVGEKAIELAKKAGIIEDEGIIWISDIPVALVLL